MKYRDDNGFTLIEPNRICDYHKTELPELSVRVRITPTHIRYRKFLSL